MNFLYQKVVSPDFCCIADNILAAVNCHYPNEISLKDILEYTGITIPRNIPPPCNNFQVSDDIDAWGIHLNESIISKLEQFLLKKGIPLYMEIRYANTMMDWQFEDLIDEEYSKSNHIICGYDYDFLTKKTPTGRGHASLISDYSNNDVWLFNPNIIDEDIHCTLYDLFNSMRRKNDGLVLLLRK